MEVVTVVEGGALKSIPVARPTEDVLPGVPWGDPAEVLTPAYWAVRGHLRGDALSQVAPKSRSLREEVAFCLLGGFGVRAELNSAFFQKLQAAGAFEPDATPSENELCALLCEPVVIDGRQVKYRYPVQRARRLSSALPRLAEKRFHTLDAQRLRGELLELEGIGPKTASWIARNWLGADDIAIIDIHVIRACQVMGVFPKEIALPRDYGYLESQFLAFSKTIGVPASVLDAVMWSEMRSFPTAFVARLT